MLPSSTLNSYFLNLLLILLPGSTNITRANDQFWRHVSLWSTKMHWLYSLQISTRLSHWAPWGSVLCIFSGVLSSFQEKMIKSIRLSPAPCRTQLLTVIILFSAMTKLSSSMTLSWNWWVLKCCRRNIVWNNKDTWQSPFCSSQRDEKLYSRPGVVRAVLGPVNLASISPEYFYPLPLAEFSSQR